MTTAMMTPPMTAAAFTFVLEDLREFLNTVQRPRLADAQWVRAAQERSQELLVRFADVRQAFSTRSQELSGAIEELVEGLREWSSEFVDRPPRRRLQRMTERLSYRYEALVREAREWMDEAMLPMALPINLKPTNYVRNLFHVSMGAIAIFCYEVLFSWLTCVWIIAGIGLAAVVLESTRRSSARWNAFLVQRVFGAISRPREMYRINGATWYTFAILAALLAFPMRATELGVIILALADPAAALAGKRWGRRRIWRDKSFVGAAAFLAVAWVIGVVFSMIIPEGPVGFDRLIMATVVALVGVVAEVFTERIDDNFTIPMLCAGVASFWFLAG
ncbi:MAG: hypothetical protein ABIK09_07385 [Pseudomonadota bacterium]